MKKIRIEDFFDKGFLKVDNFTIEFKEIGNRILISVFDKDHQLKFPTEIILIDEKIQKFLSKNNFSFFQKFVVFIKTIILINKIEKKINKLARQLK